MEQQRPAVHLRRLLIAAALLVVGVGPARATPWCLPPVFEGGERLHTSPAPRVNRLQLALRQHQLCWHAAWRPDELRVVVLGNSAVFGLGVRASETFSAQLTADLRADGLHVRLFNLAWINPYQLRDAVILREAMAYRPDVIVYPVTKAEFVHQAPTLWKSLHAFFVANRDVLREMTADPPRGLEEPVERYAQKLDQWDGQAALFERLREIGSFSRAAAGDLGRALPAALGATPRTPGDDRRPPPDYDCTETRAKQELAYADWQSWNILAELERLHEETGVEVVVVNWPLGSDPQGLCYNARFTYEHIIEFGDWLAAQAQQRRFTYVDLTGVLPDHDFFDTLHIRAPGHRLVADRLRAPLAEALARLQR